VKKSQKRPKYERDSCIPGPNFAERPYLATSVAGFSGPIFAHFRPVFLSILSKL